MSKISGIGMTSQRARNRLVEKIRSMGITNEKILEVMRLTPRHFFLEEALVVALVPEGFFRVADFVPFFVAEDFALRLGRAWPRCPINEIKRSLKS